MCWLFSFDQNWRFSPDSEWLNSPDSNTAFFTYKGVDKFERYKNQAENASH